MIWPLGANFSIVTNDDSFAGPSEVKKRGVALAQLSQSFSRPTPFAGVVKLLLGLQDPSPEFSRRCHQNLFALHRDGQHGPERGLAREADTSALSVLTFLEDNVS